MTKNLNKFEAAEILRKTDETFHTPKRFIDFDSLPDGVQHGCYLVAITELEGAVDKAACFFRLLGGKKIDMRLVFGAVVERFTKKFGTPL